MVTIPLEGASLRSCGGPKANTTKSAVLLALSAADIACTKQNTVGNKTWRGQTGKTLTTGAGVWTSFINWRQFWFAVLQNIFAEFLAKPLVAGILLWELRQDSGSLFTYLPPYHCCGNKQISSPV